MKKINKEELQDWLKEIGHKNGGLPAADVKAYQQLFDLLSCEPTESLPYNFSAKVVRKVQAETRQRNELRSYLRLIVVVSMISAFVYGLFVLLKPQLGNGFLTIAADYKWVFALGIVCFLTIQYLDQVLIKSTFFKNQRR